MKSNGRTQTSPTHYPVLDVLLGGGLHAGLTEVYGNAGTGKSMLALQIARVVCERKGQVLYWNVENGIAPKKAAEILGPYKDQVHLSMESDAYKVYQILTEVMWYFDLIVFDTFTAITHPDNNTRWSLREMISSWLYTHSRQKGTSVLMVNQSRFNPRIGDVVPEGGSALRKYAHHVVRVQREENGHTAHIERCHGGKGAPYTMPLLWDEEKAVFDLGVKAPHLKQGLALLNRYSTEEAAPICSNCGRACEEGGRVCSGEGCEQRVCLCCPYCSTHASKELP